MAASVEQEPWHAFSDKPEQQPPSVSHIEISSSDEEDGGSGGRSSTYRSSKDSSTVTEGDDDDGGCKRKKTRSLKEIDEELVTKKLKLEEPLAAIPLRFLAPLPVNEVVPVSAVPVDEVEPFSHSLTEAVVKNTTVGLDRLVSRQFWKAGEFGNDVCADSSQSSGTFNLSFLSYVGYICLDVLSIYSELWCLIYFINNNRS